MNAATAQRTSAGIGSGVSPPARSSARKAAILIVSVGEALAQAIVAGLDRADVDALNLELTRLDNIDPAEQRAVLEEFLSLAAQRERIVFDDVVHIDAGTIRAAHQTGELELWTLALAGASRVARERVLGALSPRDADALRRALTSIGPFRLDDVERAQAHLVEAMLRIQEGGGASPSGDPRPRIAAMDRV